MNEQEVVAGLNEVGAVLNGHFVLSNGWRHSNIYINKDAVFPYPHILSRLCRAIAERFVDDDVEVVVGPAIGAIGMASWTAYHLSELTNRKVLTAYAQKRERLVFKGGIAYGVHVGYQDPGDILYETFEEGEKLFVADGDFEFARGFDALIRGKRVLVVEDILTSGDSAKKVIKAIIATDGQVVGLGALCNRGAVTPEVLGIPQLEALLNINPESWTRDECPLCKRGVPIDTHAGKGREFLESKGKQLGQ
jgi:orotate phosphoribosyltransferase